MKTLLERAAEVGEVRESSKRPGIWLAFCPKCGVRDTHVDVGTGTWKCQDAKCGAGGGGEEWEEAGRGAEGGGRAGSGERGAGESGERGAGSGITSAAAAMICGNCRFRTEGGQCRRWVPGPDGQWPQTLWEDWCGEFEGTKG